MAQLQSLSIKGKDINEYIKDNLPEVDYIIEKDNEKITKKVKHKTDPGNNNDTAYSEYDTIWHYRKYKSGYIEMWTSARVDGSIKIGASRDYFWSCILPFEIIFDDNFHAFVNMTTQKTALWCGHNHLTGETGFKFGGSSNTFTWSCFNFSSTEPEEEQVTWNIFVGGQLASTT